MELKGRIIFKGKVSGEAMVSPTPMSFYGGIDPQTGNVTEKENLLFGVSVAGKILVFPTGKGSTVGSYVLYRLKKNGKAPLAIINRECEPIVAVGAIISEVPLVDKIDVSRIKTGDRIEIDAEMVKIN